MKNVKMGVLASLDPDLINTLTEAILAKLEEKNGGFLLPKQGVGSSNLLTRSNPLASQSSQKKF
jgi:hypothetical protein